MLYNPKWEVKPRSKVRPKVCSLDGLAAWLETQNPSTTYSYGDIYGCLLSRYFRASGYWGAVVGVGSFNHWRYLFPLFYKKYPDTLDDVAVKTPYTYVAALARARSLAEMSEENGRLIHGRRR